MHMLLVCCRKKAVDLVLGDSKEQLDAFKATFHRDLGEAPAGQVVAGRKRTAPPCRSYADLFIVSELMSYVEQCERAEEKIDLENISKEMLAAKKPLLELVSASKAGKQDFAQVRSVCVCVPINQRVSSISS